ncbi:two-component system response regulator [Halorubrum salipaludis]|uniref:Two-component system response regulator n=1 Tax=Halorubrum salipaludis TaxID=2032630 RepID=A0A2A2FKG5_9EURY|nr:MULTISPECIES: response regulator [Halorubrum]PAU85132.1 two-component system response regulator [Halorubrum salipaludis]
MTDAPLRVLCVDDEPGLAALVAAYLERDDAIDCETVVETDPAAALDRIEREPFDCVVSDYDMPGRTGVELLSDARESRPDLPFLLFSATEPDAIAAEMVRAGVSDYVTKRGGADGYTALLRRVEHAVEGDGGRFESEPNRESGGDPSAAVALDGVCTVAPDGTFEFVGEEYGELYGYDPEELVGERWQRLHPTEEVEHIRTHIIPAVMAGERWTGTSTGLRADGSTFAESKMVTTTSDDRLVISVSEFEEVASGAPGARADD